MRNQVLVVLVIAACGPDSGSGSIPIDGLEAAGLNVICDIYARCGVFPDIESCRSTYNVLLSSNSPDNNRVAAVKAGRVIYHGDKARECYNEFAGTSCDRAQAFSNRNTPLACDETFVGTVGDAGACVLNEECVSQRCSVPTCGANMCCQGTCIGGTAPVRANLGQACSTAMRCNEGYCNTTTSVCTAFLADGATCTSAASCQSNSCATTCQRPVSANDACTTSSQCRDIGNVCNTASKTCVPNAQLGDACTSTSDCSPLTQCDTATTSKCVTRPKLGDTCTGTGSCAIDASYCEATTMRCTALKPDGATCALTIECASRHCDTTTTHTCVTPPVCI
jgi:hypothetical protein